jgi:DNA-binding transcriptional LysR family regulator
MLNVDQMKSYILKTFVKVVETGSFSKTAEELNITQSAISHRIKFLEDEYNCSLIDRSSQPFKPTECGRILVEKARRILLIEQEITRELKKHREKTTLKVCATATYGAFYLPKVVNRFLRQTPETVGLNSILLTPAEAITGLLNSAYDIGVIEHLHSLNAAGCQCFDLPADEMVFISSPSLGIAAAELSIKELLGERLITRKEGCSCRDLLDHNLLGHNISVAHFKSTLIYDDIPLTIQTVINGGGIAFVSKCIVQELLTQELLRAHTVQGFTHERKRTALIRSEMQQDPLASLFMECIFEEVKISLQKCRKSATDLHHDPAE